MRNYTKCFATLMVALMGLSAAAQQYYPVRDRLEVTSLDGTWQLKIEGSDEYHIVNVPGNWETQGVKTPEYGRRLSERAGVYKRSFEYKEEWKGREVILRLDGVQYGFTAYVNGKEVGSGHSAHTMHQFPITPFLREGRNEMELKVSTHSKYWLFDVCDAWSLTGIKRSVELFSVPVAGSLADVVFTSKVNNDHSAEISVKVHVNGNGKKITASLLDERYHHVCDMQGKVEDGTVVLTRHLENPRLWNAETPNLYRLHVKLFDDEGRLLQSIEEKVGIREVRVENGKILLNNREIFLRGACLSENDAIEGGAMTPLNRRRQLQQMKDANINFIRYAHYPLDPIVNRLCDEMGFYVCNEIPYASRGNEYLKYDPNVLQELKARAKATIDRDRNSPSIIMWSFGNENNIYKCQDSLLMYVKDYDPSRLRGIPQKKGEFLSSIKKPSEYADVICGHYANDGVLADAAKYSRLPVINTEFAHSLGTAFGELENKYEIFRREANMAGGAVWSYQDQSILTHHFNQERQVLKGVRIDSLRFMDSHGLNSIPEGEWERGKEGTDGVVYGDGYPQEDYFELAQVYTPVFVRNAGRTSVSVKLEIENRFDFITLHGYSLCWQLRNLYRTLQQDTLWLTASARTAEQVEIPIGKLEGDWILAIQILRPDGSLCYERSFTLCHDMDFNQMLVEAEGENCPLLRNWLKSGFKLRVGRPMTIGLDHRRKDLWYPYILSPVDVKVKKQKGNYRITCRWQREEESNHYVEGDIWVAVSKKGTVKVDYTLLPSDSIGGKFLDYGLVLELPEDYTEVAWLGQGPFSHTPDKTAYNNRGIWRLHKDDIRFYGNRAEVDLLAVCSPVSTFTLCTEGKNIHLENIDGKICLTDNLVIGTYGTKFLAPHGEDAGKLGLQKGSITLKYNAKELLKDILGTLSPVNPEQPYLESYGK